MDPNGLSALPQNGNGSLVHVSEINPESLHDDVKDVQQTGHIGGINSSQNGDSNYPIGDTISNYRVEDTISVASSVAPISTAEIEWKPSSKASLPISRTPESRSSPLALVAVTPHAFLNGALRTHESEGSSTTPSSQILSRKSSASISRAFSGISRVTVEKSIRNPLFCCWCQIGTIPCFHRKDDKDRKWGFVVSIQILMLLVITFMVGASVAGTWAVNNHFLTSSMNNLSSDLVQSIALRVEAYLQMMLDVPKMLAINSALDYDSGLTSTSNYTDMLTDWWKMMDVTESAYALYIGTEKNYMYGISRAGSLEAACNSTSKPLSAHDYVYFISMSAGSLSWFCASSDGSFNQSNPVWTIPFHVTTRPWYEQINSADHTRSWSTVYASEQFNTTGDVFVTFGSKVNGTSDSDPGILGVDITVQQVSQYLNESFINTTVSELVFVAQVTDDRSTNGIMVASSDGIDDVYYANGTLQFAYNNSNAIISGLYLEKPPSMFDTTRPVSNNITTSTVTVNGVTYFVASDIIQNTPNLKWAVYVAMPANELLEFYYKERNRNMILNLIILATAILCGVILALVITCPLLVLRLRMDRISRKMCSGPPSTHAPQTDLKALRSLPESLRDPQFDPLYDFSEDTGDAVKETSRRSFSFERMWHNFFSHKSALSEIRGMQMAFNQLSRGTANFMKYVPRDVVRDLLRRDESARLDMAERNITICFCDLQGFTTMVETLVNDDLTLVIRLYFNAVTKALTFRRATIDKYIGDAVMAFWNAPARLKQHHVEACYAALECIKGLEAPSEMLQKHGLPPLIARFGLHTGTCLVGNVGSPTRMNYTAIGDAVNLASRLESLNKVYGSTILVSGTVYVHAKDLFIFRWLDRVMVKGKSIATDVYELICERPPEGVPIPSADLIALYQEALCLLLARRFDRSFDLLTRIVDKYPDDKPAARLLARAHYYMKNPHEFNEVHKMEEK